MYGSVVLVGVLLGKRWFLIIGVSVCWSFILIVIGNFGGNFIIKIVYYGLL